MDAVPDEDLVVVRGLARTVAYAREASGRQPAREFLLGLSASELRRMYHQFQQLTAMGQLSSSRQFRKELGQIWAFKLPTGVRVAAFQHGRVWYLTHGFRKQRDQWPRTELERAERIRREHLAWMGNFGAR